MDLAFITWDVDPTIFNLFGREIRYYGITWALAFIVGTYVMQRLYKKDGVSTKAVDALTFYIILGTIIGARLGHCFFYNNDWYYFKNPIEILYIWEGGLASHGAALGIFISLYLFNRKYKMGYLWVMDRLVLAVAISGCFIRFGNLMNSEIVGKPTDASYAFVFPENFKSGVQQLSSGMAYISDLEPTENSYKDSNLTLPEYTATLTYEEGTAPESKMGIYASIVNLNIYNNIEPEDNIVIIKPRPIDKIDFSGNSISFPVYGVPRHASQLYESISSFILFAILLYLFFNTNLRFHHGKLFGGFMVVLFSLRFAYEFSKEVQESFEESMALNMGQILSIIPIVVGLYLVFGYKKYEEKAPVWIDKEEDDSKSKVKGDKNKGL